MVSHSGLINKRFRLPPNDQAPAFSSLDRVSRTNPGNHHDEGSREPRSETQSRSPLTESVLQRFKLMLKHRIDYASNAKWRRLWRAYTPQGYSFQFARFIYE